METSRCNRVIAVTDHYNITVNVFDAEEPARCNTVLIVTKLIVSGTQYIIFSVGVYGKSHAKMCIKIVLLSYNYIICFI